VKASPLITPIPDARNRPTRTALTRVPRLVAWARSSTSSVSCGSRNRSTATTSTTSPLPDALSCDVAAGDYLSELVKPPDCAACGGLPAVGCDSLRRLHRLAPWRCCRQAQHLAPPGTADPQACVAAAIPICGTWSGSSTARLEPLLIDGAPPVRAGGTAPPTTSHQN